jgi:hypothetical protein
MVVFWCEHAKASDWVRREYLTALELGKKVIPVLLDDSEIPDALQLQGVDLRGGGGHAAARQAVSVAFCSPHALIRDLTLLKPGTLRVRAEENSSTRSPTLLIWGLAFVSLALLRSLSTPFDSTLIGVFYFIVLLIGVLFVALSVKARADHRRLRELDLTMTREIELLVAALDEILRDRPATEVQLQRDDVDPM